MEISEIYDFGGKTQEEWEAEHEYWEVAPLTQKGRELRSERERAHQDKIDGWQKIEAHRGRLRKQAREERPALVERDGDFCQHCGTTESLTVDHIVPLARGGTNDLGNLQLLCNTCNAAKGARG